MRKSKKEKTNREKSPKDGVPSVETEMPPSTTSRICSPDYVHEFLASLKNATGEIDPRIQFVGGAESAKRALFWLESSSVSRGLDEAKMKQRRRIARRDERPANRAPAPNPFKISPGCFSPGWERGGFRKKGGRASVDFTMARASAQAPSSLTRLDDLAL